MVTRVLIIAFLALSFATQSFAQNASVLRIDADVSDTCGSHHFIHNVFGNVIGCSYGLDTAYEYLCPPYPPPSEDAFWTNIPGRGGQTFGFRCFGPDYRGWSSSHQVDTFNLLFYSWCGGPAFLTLHWPDSSFLATRCDSIFIIDTSRQLPRFNMMRRDSVTFAISSTGFGNLLFYKYGSKLVDIVTGVRQEEQNQPVRFTLLQNFPNPFNNATTIRYTLPKSSSVILKVYDLLGQKITTLVNQLKQPGEYTATWNAEGMPSGVYFYRLQAGEFVDVKKLVLMR